MSTIRGILRELKTTSDQFNVYFEDAPGTAVLFEDLTSWDAYGFVATRDSSGNEAFVNFDYVSQIEHIVA